MAIVGPSLAVGNGWVNNKYAIHKYAIHCMVGAWQGSTLRSQQVAWAGPGGRPA